MYVKMYGTYLNIFFNYTFGMMHLQVITVILSVISNNTVKIKSKYFPFHFHKHFFLQGFTHSLQFYSVTPYTNLNPNIEQNKIQMRISY